MSPVAVSASVNRPCRACRPSGLTDRKTPSDRRPHSPACCLACPSPRSHVRRHFTHAKRASPAVVSGAGRRTQLPDIRARNHRKRVKRLPRLVAGCCLLRLAPSVSFPSDGVNAAKHYYETASVVHSPNAGGGLSVKVASELQAPRAR